MDRRKVERVGCFLELGCDSVPGASLVEQRGRRPGANKAKVVEYLRSGKKFIFSPGFDDDYFEPVSPTSDRRDQARATVRLLKISRGDASFVAPAPQGKIAVRRIRPDTRRNQACGIVDCAR